MLLKRPCARSDGLVVQLSCTKVNRWQQKFVAQSWDVSAG